MTAALVVQRLSVRGFRNIEAVDLEPAPRVNVIFGNNGQGKTSLLEALYFVSTSRSFRAERLRDMLRDGAETAVVRMTVSDDGLGREQRASLGARGRAMQLDGKKPSGLGQYATRTPVVVFHPGDLALASGAASLRRTLLDRIALFEDPASADNRARYTRAQRARQAALEQRGPGAEDLSAHEQVMATHGSALTRARARAAERLVAALIPAFHRMFAADAELGAHYAPGGTVEPDAFVEELARRRAQDLRRRGASFGPHRDDLELSIGGRSVRHHASQGQQRIVALSAKWAELECVRAARGAHPILLLDDVSSELDPTRTGAVYDFLRQTPSQLFVTTTRPELFSTPGLGAEQRRDWEMSGGRIDTAGRH